MFCISFIKKYPAGMSKGSLQKSDWKGFLRKQKKTVVLRAERSEALKTKVRSGSVALQ